jgi:hypothetical protein
MSQFFTERAEAAVVRYGYFLDVLRSQADVVFRRGPTDGRARDEAVAVAQDAARAFLSTEQGQVNDDSAEVARRAHSAALSDLGLSDAPLEDRFGEFVFSAAYYTSRVIAGQAERDVMTMAQHIQSTALRIDLYVRSGRHSLSSAAAAVMLEDRNAPAFKFMDRMGRRFKATKHIRDIYRQHLINIYNEVYMDVVASHGHEIVRVDHPEPTYKWFGEPLLIVTGATNTEDFPLYYDVREEIFHPSSRATLTIAYPGAD